MLKVAKMFRRQILCFLTFSLVIFSENWLLAQAPNASSKQASSQRSRFVAIDSIMKDAIAEGHVPGGVVLVGHNGKIVFRKAYGWRSLEPTREAMTVDTVFDMASLTKCIATTMSVMKLIEEGRIRLNAPVASYLPGFAQNGKQEITVRELLTHFSGFRPDLDLKDPWQGRATAYDLVMQEKPIYPPGTVFVYSDINFETLGFLVEKVSGMTLNEYATENIFAPLGMDHTRFLPPSDWSPRIAPTEYDEHGKMLRGVVHDPTARRMGGIAGHAGLFSTADDLAKLAQQLLSGDKILSRQAVTKMTTPQQPATAASLRGLGWDIDSPFFSNRGALLPVGSFGHTGFTGTLLWIDPVTNTYVILLTNAVHPRGYESAVALAAPSSRATNVVLGSNTSLVSLRHRITTAVVRSLDLSPSESDKLRLTRITGYNESLMAERLLTVRNGEVKAGIDVLEAHAFRELHPDPSHPVRVGLVTNQTGVDSHGHRTADALAHAPGVELAAMFSPEHGIAGILETTDIGDSKDAATGVPIYSVYGSTDPKRRPKDAQLAGLDTIVYDIQDIGVRFYTDETTLGYFLEAAAKSGKEIVVLDRPDPINGIYVQGPIADPGSESFVNYGMTPIRHGLTLGELARMFNGERSINAKLTVVPMEDWLRGDWYDSTGMMWINTSPNMRDPTEAALYPGIGMLEGSNVSVGRGTDTPFEFLGAPWIDSLSLAHYLNAREISGVRFTPVIFTPKASTYANQKCGGVYIIVTDREALDAPELGLEIAGALHHLYPDEFRIAALSRLMCNRATLDALTAGEDPRRIAEDWQDALVTFKKLRSKYLLY